jgi:hypothetical protein
MKLGKLFVGTAAGDWLGEIAPTGRHVMWSCCRCNYVGDLAAGHPEAIRQLLEHLRDDHR